MAFGSGPCHQVDLRIRWELLVGSGFTFILQVATHVSVSIMFMGSINQHLSK